MKKILFILMFAFVALSVLSAKDEQDNSKYDVCEKVDKAQIASILGWNEAATEVETLTSSSGRSLGVCRYTYQGEELIINVKEKLDSKKYAGSFNAFSSVKSPNNPSGENIHKLTYLHSKYEIELNYKSAEFTGDAFKLMSDIGKIVE